MLYGLNLTDLLGGLSLLSCLKLLERLFVVSYDGEIVTCLSINMVDAFPCLDWF